MYKLLFLMGTLLFGSHAWSLGGIYSNDCTKESSHKLNIFIPQGNTYPASIKIVDSKSSLPFKKTFPAYAESAFKLEPCKNNKCFKGVAWLKHSKDITKNYSKCDNELLHASVIVMPVGSRKVLVKYRIGPQWYIYDTGDDAPACMYYLPHTRYPAQDLIMQRCD